MEEDNKEIREEQNEEIKEEKQVQEKKKSSLAKKLLIGTIGIAVAGIIGYNSSNKNNENFFGPDIVEIKAGFNDQFTAYETVGEHTITVQQLQELIRTVNTSNNVTYKGEHEIKWKNGEQPQLVRDGRYQVELTDTDSDGYYDEITVTEKKD